MRTESTRPVIAAEGVLPILQVGVSEGVSEGLVIASLGQGSHGAVEERLPILQVTIAIAGGTEKVMIASVHKALFYCLDVLRRGLS